MAVRLYANTAPIRDRGGQETTYSDALRLLFQSGRLPAEQDQLLPSLNQGQMPIVIDLCKEKCGGQAVQSTLTEPML
jgi:hypothetical protein